MSDFDKVFQEAYDYCIDDSCKYRYEASKIFAKEIWNHKQQKIDAIKKHIDSFYAEAELWGFESDQALHQIDLIQELLK